MLEIVVIFSMGMIMVLLSRSQYKMFFQIKKNIFNCGGVIFGPTVIFDTTTCLYNNFNYNVFIKSLECIEIFKQMCKNDSLETYEDDNDKLRINVVNKFNGSKFSVIFYLSENEFIERHMCFLHDHLVEDSSGIRLSYYFYKICMENNLKTDKIETCAINSLKNKTLILFQNKDFETYKKTNIMEKRYRWTLSEKKWQNIND